MKKNYLYNLVLTLFNILFPIFSFPYASRILGPLGIGRFQFVFSFAQYFVIIAVLGVPLYGVREIARHRNDKERQSKVFSELLVISFIMSMILTLIYLGVIFSISYFYPDRNLYLVAGLFIIFSFTSIDWLYSGLEEFKMIAVRSVIVKLLSLVFLYGFVKNADDVLIYLGINVFSSLGNNAYNVLTAGRKVDLTFKDLRLKQHLKPMFLIFGMALGSSVYTLLDVVLLGFLSDTRSVGLYSAAVKLSKIIIPFIISVGTVALPQMSQAFANKNMHEVRARLGKSLHFIWFFSIPACTGLMLFAPEFIIVFSGRQFIGATLSMQILSTLPVIIGIANLWGVQILIPAGKDKELLYAVLGGIVVAVTLNFILVPSMKDVGAAIANVATELVVTLLNLYYIRKHFELFFNWPVAFKSLVASVLFVPIALLTRQLHLNVLMTAAIGVSICGGIYLAVQGLIFRDSLVHEGIQMLTGRFKRKTDTPVNIPAE